jgi:MFS family permease
MVLIGISYLGKVIALPLWGRVAHASGARRLLWIGSAAIVPMAGLWLAADWFTPWHTILMLPIGPVDLALPLAADRVYLGCVQLISGMVWAAYELAMALMFLEAIPRHERPAVLTYYNFGNAAAQVTGGLIGATILQLGHETHAAYMAVFAASSLLRFVIVVSFRAGSRLATQSDESLDPPSRTRPVATEINGRAAA